MLLRVCLGLASAIVLSAPVPSAPTVSQFYPFDEDESRLVAAAGLQPVDGHGGEMLRYVLRRAYPRNGPFTAQIVQVHWPPETPYPRILLIELETQRGASLETRVTERREGFMQRPHFDRLLDNVVAAASAVGVRPERGAIYVCSHGPAARVDLSIPTLGLWITRTSNSRCGGGDDPAIIAGELIADAVRVELDLDWYTPH
jgi:hypothetical protein